MRRTIVLAGVLPFVSAFLGGVLALSLIAPSSATAQSGQLQEVRATAFTLVGQDGTVLARLAPGNLGFGNLALFDTAGTQRLQLQGNGRMGVNDADGTLVFQAGRSFEASGTGRPPVNGVELGPGGSVSMLPPLP